jgi:hypothetical protein
VKATVKSHVTVVHWKIIDEVSAHDVPRLKFMSDDYWSGAKNFRGEHQGLHCARFLKLLWRSLSIALASTAGEMVSMKALEA